MTLFRQIVALFMLYAASTTTGLAESDHISLCRETSLNYARFADEGNTEGFINLFADDVFFQTGSFTVKSKEELRKLFEGDDSPPNTTMHVISNHQIVSEAGKLNGKSYYQLFLAKGQGQAPYKLSAQPVYAGVYEDEYVIEHDVCKFTKRVARRTFIFLSPTLCKRN
jgi:hypothetical protein